MRKKSDEEKESELLKYLGGNRQRPSCSDILGLFKESEKVGVAGIA